MGGLKQCWRLEAAHIRGAGLSSSVIWTFHRQIRLKNRLKY